MLHVIMIDLVNLSDDSVDIITDIVMNEITFQFKDILYEFEILKNLK